MVIGLLAVASLCASTDDALAQGSEETDRAALAALYHAANGPNWTDSTNWLTDAPLSEWYGVTMESSRVTELVLLGNALSGPVPTELGNLANLQSLSLSRNALSGPVPTELGNLANLRILNLGGNALSGPVPTELGNLANLERLDLSGNALSGPVPTELGNLANGYARFATKVQSNYLVRRRRDANQLRMALRNTSGARTMVANWILGMRQVV